MKKVLFILLLLVFSASLAFAEDITITSSVERNEIEFGDQIELTISVRKALAAQNSRTFSNNGFSFSFNSFNMMSGMDDLDINVENIPDFDILGRRSSQQSRSVNGKGESVKQVILTIVPQKEGTLTIPAFSVKDKDGNLHSSNPITIKVNKAAEDPEEPEDDDKAVSNEESSDSKDQSNNMTPEAKKEDNAFKLLLFLGIGLFVFVILIMIAAFIARTISEKTDKKPETSNVEDAVIVKESVKPTLVAEPKKEIVKIDFVSEAATLKYKYKEINAEFYRAYFDLFKKSCCSKNQFVSEDMTFDELLAKCKDLAGTSNIAQATHRIAEDIEMVMYANSMPSRNFSAIETDVKEIINSL